VKIQILDEAQEDLIQGFRFYEGREPGLGTYFLDCLFSDIDSLLIQQEFMQLSIPIIVAYPNVSLLRFITVSRGSLFEFTPYSIAAETPLGSGGG
jgi:hypothetical protein